jgi:hypothetical protein
MKLDALGDRLMYRLAYRNFGDHASLVANHTVLTSEGNTAIRWYDVRNPGGTPTLYQQGTFSPDADNRWMGSIAMDRTGNIGVGYSASSIITYPSIRFTGWEVGDPLGALQTETFAVVGSGSQTGYSRWGDYSSMRIDPTDDCTFWYTQEYQATTQSANWNTRILSFRFASSPNPSTFGQTVTFTATVTPSATGTVSFYEGATLLGSAPLSASSDAQWSTASLGEGTHAITAVYSGDGTFMGSTSNDLTQTVNVAAGSFSLSVVPSSRIVARNGSTSFAIDVTSSGGFSGDVTLSVSGVPPQSSASFSQNPVAGGSGSSTLTINIGRRTPRKTYTLTIAGTSGAIGATVDVAVTVQ